MTVRQRVKRIGGSLGVLLPRDIAKAMDIEEGAEVRLTLAAYDRGAWSPPER